MTYNTRTYFKPLHGFVSL